MIRNCYTPKTLSPRGHVLHHHILPKNLHYHFQHQKPQYPVSGYMNPIPRPSSYPLLGPKYPLLRTIYPQLKVQGRSWYTGILVVQASAPSTLRFESKNLNPSLCLKPDTALQPINPKTLKPQTPKPRNSYNPSPLTLNPKPPNP